MSAAAALGEWRLSLRQVLVATALVAVVALVLGASRVLIGPHTAMSGYLTMLFLLAVVRAGNWRVRAGAAVWALAVALLGFAVGGAGIVATLVALVVVSLIQGMVTLGEVALLTRSPVNLLAFASMSQGGAEVWQVLLGSAIGAAAIVVFGALARGRAGEPRAARSVRDRLGYGIATAVGAVLIVLGGEAVGFPYVGWALLSFCIMLSFETDMQAERGFWRLLGTAVGAVLAVGITALPEPIPIVVAVICGIACVAYINAGNYALFMLFLTPAILVTTASEYSPVALGVYRIEAVLVATALAFACGAVLRALRQR
ncbi:FUSC family protein [Leucobacter rhizosphaerae]|uniref:FUSC family protein n=1 Tax=Leucobacter rhizosphaerae TaxID=2932245 RepID=A0ABY4FT04_9MICO|nr:FUSC family protein [Leucobacter rhizosphaerae]UOQ59436.1 FUSC family protein [Leucobacter rhizosphaerae]